MEKGLDVAVAAYVARAPVPFLTIGGLDGWSAVTQSVPLDSTHAELRLKMTETDGKVRVTVQAVGLTWAQKATFDSQGWDGSYSERHGVRTYIRSFGPVLWPDEKAELQNVAGVYRGIFVRKLEMPPDCPTELRAIFEF